MGDGTCGANRVIDGQRNIEFVVRPLGGSSSFRVPTLVGGGFGDQFQQPTKVGTLNEELPPKGRTTNVG